MQPPRLGGVINPNWKIRSGSVAVRCVALAMRCGAIALRCVAIAMRCDATRCEAVCACEERSDSPGWCFQWALTVTMAVAVL